MSEIEILYGESERKSRSLESSLYSKTAALESALADGLLGRQELEGVRIELSNLHQALSQLQWRSERDRKTFLDAAGESKSKSESRCRSKNRSRNESESRSRNRSRNRSKYKSKCKSR